MDDQEIKKFSTFMNLSKDEFQNRFTFVDEDHDRLQINPRPMLKDKSCTIYDNRPDTCRSYPHLEKSGFLGRLIGIIGSLGVCPIAYNVFEELKVVTKWKSKNQ